jgi:hypothetical protein
MRLLRTLLPDLSAGARATSQAGQGARGIAFETAEQGGETLATSDEQTEDRTAFEAARERERLRARRFLALALLIVSALFSGIVVGVLVVTHVAEQAATPADPTTGEARPPESETLGALREQLKEAQGPAAAAIKQAIREEDQRLRTVYQTRRRRYTWGAWLLLVGLVGVVLSARWYASLDPEGRMPSRPSERPDAEEWRRKRRRRLIAIGAVGGVVIASLAIMGLMGGSSMPPTEKAAPPKEVLPERDRAGFEDDWPRFRGPTGMGIVKNGAYPLYWDGESGANIVWKTPIPVLEEHAPRSPGDSGVVPYGKSSPIMWGNTIFLTGGGAEKLEVFAYERKTGTLLWRTPIESPLLEKKPTEDEEPFRVMEDTGYAAGTPATDGRRVFAVFATADVAALDFEGNVLWVHHLGKPDNMYGMATSLVVYEDTVILQHDQGGDAMAKKSALIAFDAATGDIRWSTPRPVPNSWTTPIIVNTGSRTILVTSSSGWVIAYDPETGKELWRAEGVTGDVAPSPIYAGGLVFVTTQYSRLLAIRTGGTGDVTKTHTAWVGEDGMSDAASPVSDGQLFFQAHSSGFLTCYDVRETKPPDEWSKYPRGVLHWEKELDGEFWSSPTLVGELVYLTGRKGKTFIFPLAKEFKLKASNELGEEVFASPAFGDGQIIVRTGKHLLCIAKTGDTRPPAPKKQEALEKQAPAKEKTAPKQEPAAEKAKAKAKPAPPSKKAKAPPKAEPEPQTP